MADDSGKDMTAGSLAFTLCSHERTIISIATGRTFNAVNAIFERLIGPPGEDISVMIDAPPPYRPTLRIDVDLDFAIIAKAYNTVMAYRGDPRRAYLPDHGPSIFRNLERATQVHARSHGFYGKTGGWIYNRHDKVVCQGWGTFGQRLIRAGTILDLSTPRKPLYVIPKGAP